MCRGQQREQPRLFGLGGREEAQEGGALEGVVGVLRVAADDRRGAVLEDDAGAQRELLHGAGFAGGDLDREAVRVHGVLVRRAGAGGEEAAEGAADADGADATAPRLPGREQAVDEEERLPHREDGAFRNGEGHSEEWRFEFPRSYPH